MRNCQLEVNQLKLGLLRELIHPSPSGLGYFGWTVGLGLQRKEN